MENNNNWRVEYRDSNDSEILGLLTDKNHIMTMVHQAPMDWNKKLFSLYKILGFLEKPRKVNRNTTVQHTITSWKGNYEDGNDIAVFYMGDKVAYWQPRVELALLRNTMATVSTNVQMGYVDGRYSHLGFAASNGMQSSGMFPGYVFWIDCKGEEVTLEEQKEFNLKANNTIEVKIADQDVYGFKMKIKNFVETICDEIDAAPLLIGEFDKIEDIESIRNNTLEYKEKFLQAAKDLIYNIKY